MKKVVVIEDNRNFLELERLFVENFNDAECMTFINPIEACEYIIKERDIDIVISDYDMSYMNGIEVALKLFANDIVCRLIICSGHEESYLREMCKKHGIEEKVEYLCKTNVSYLKHLI